MILIKVFHYFHPFWIILKISIGCKLARPRHPKKDKPYIFLGLPFLVIQSYGEQMYLLQAMMIC
jgi:hypothetical protein